LGGTVVWRRLERYPTSSGQPPDKHARQNKELERDASINGDPNDRTPR
jgi:hypothetical protein